MDAPLGAIPDRVLTSNSRIYALYACDSAVMAAAVWFMVYMTVIALVSAPAVIVMACGRAGCEPAIRAGSVEEHY